MKNIIFVALTLFLSTSSFAQNDIVADSTGLPGDHFSLEGALELFKQSASPEAFEKAINTSDNHVNNLDLNGDGDTDYVKVISTQEGDVQLFILQVPVSESENQDIAVIEVEKTGNENAVIQIVGDEDIYGDQIIIEPSDSDEYNYENDDIYDKSSERTNQSNPIVVNVWAWPLIRHVYAPGYRPWLSPWRWRIYPSWWSPWKPYRWSVWHPYKVRHYHPRFRHVHTHRVVRAPHIYRPIRVSATTVRTRHAGAHANYKVTRSKTKVTGPRGNSVTKKTTTVRGSRGNVKAKKTTVKKSRRGN